MTLGEFIKKYREEHGLSIRGFAELSGVSIQQISNIEKGIGNNGKKMTSTMKTYKKIAEAVGMSGADFMNMLNENALINPNVTEDNALFPILGDVRAGYERFSFEEYDEQIEIPLSWLHGRPQEEFFVLRVIGDSMMPKYLDGDLVLVLKQSATDYNGQIAVVLYDDDKATIKHVDQGADYMSLRPVNAEFDARTYQGEELDHCRILGIPKRLIRDLSGE